MTAAAGSPMDAVARPRRSRDPLALVLGDEEPPVMLWAAGGVALALHAAMLAFAIVSGLLAELRLAMLEDRERLHDYFWRVYDIEVPKAAPKQEEKVAEPPPPEPAPLPPAPKQAPPKDDDPYKNLPPAPAKAAPVEHLPPKDDEPEDLTKFSIVTGDGTATYGQQSAQGKGDTPTMGRNPSLQGVPGGRGTASAAPAAAPAEDRSRAVGLVGGSTWNCPFPPEADADQIDQAVVTVQVTVKPDGGAVSATVVADPGHGFGRAARICALARRYTPALDKAGAAILSSVPVNVRFSR